MNALRFVVFAGVGFKGQVFSTLEKANARANKWKALGYEAWVEAHLAPVTT